jgi:hypothetical protein
LPDEKVTVKYVLRQKGNITNRSHVAYGGKLEDVVDKYCARMSPTRRDSFLPIFTPEEQAFLEKELALAEGDLNPNKSDGYFSQILIRLSKAGISLDLSKADDYIKYKVLLSYTDKVSPDIFTTHTRKTYDYEIVRAKDVTQKATKRLNYNKESYKILGKIENSRDQLAGAYRILTGKKISSETSKEWLEARVGNLIEEDAKRFVEVLTDPLYEGKLFIERAIDHGAIKKLKGLYYTIDGVELANEGETPTLINAINYLDNIENQDLRLSIEIKMK